jgi:hypothetical protein
LTSICVFRKALFMKEKLPPKFINNAHNIKVWPIYNTYKSKAISQLPYRLVRKKRRKV